MFWLTWAALKHSSSALARAFPTSAAYMQTTEKKKNPTIITIAFAVSIIPPPHQVSYSPFPPSHRIFVFTCAAL
jgi:hypothetical protein